jgi:glycolate oxidase FAD binding subunit
MTEFFPRNENDVRDLVRWAAWCNEALSISGSGSRAGFGYPVHAPHAVSLSGLCGIRDYDPRELVLTAAAGTRLADIDSLLSQHGQHLAFEPPDPGPLFGSPLHGTLGGVFLANQSGPRRFHAGAARDHLLGIRAVNGRGEIWKSGGRVIKNVTGYDLSKLIAGSWGTLSIVTEITCKVLPAPANAITACIPAGDIRTALGILTQAASGPLAPTGLAWCPPLPDTPGIPVDLAGHCLIRFEGTSSGIYERVRALGRAMDIPGTPACRTDAESAALWRSLRDAAPVASRAVVIKLSIPPAVAPSVADCLSAPCVRAWYVDAAGGWIWIGAGTHGVVELIAALRAHVSANGGGAVIVMRAPAEAKCTPILTPPPAPLAALNRRIRECFDPMSLFNPGRLYPH